MKLQQGVALLWVLWVLALLSLLLAAVAGTVQLQQRQASWQREQAQAALAAQAGLAEAVLALQARDAATRWRADGQPHRVRFVTAGTATAEVSVRLRSERGKLDLNAAPAADVARVLQACGGAPAQANQVVAALEQVRNGPTPLRTLDEFRALPGVTWALYQRALPLLTVWSGQAQPAPGLAPPRLARALGLPAIAPAGLDPGQILTVDSVARQPGGARAHLQVTLMMTAAKEGARPYRVLRWQE